MESQTQLSNPPSPCIYYATAPNTPNAAYGRWNTMDLNLYLSAPATPPPKMDGGDDEFEFGSSHREGEWRLNQPDGRTMTFADELFVDGLVVMPLKPPPRIHGGNNCDTPVPSLNRSPRTGFRLPFSQKSSWNDDFDPFMVALEMVRDEKRERDIHSRRSRSHSPFRTKPNISDEFICHRRQAPPAENGAVVNFNFKGSVYARWVRERTREGVSPKCTKGSFFGNRVSCLKAELEKPRLSEGKFVGKIGEEGKMRKLKGLLKYASLGSGKNNRIKQRRKDSGGGVEKASYFSELSLKSRGSGKVTLCHWAQAVYKPSINVCVGS